LIGSDHLEVIFRVELAGERGGIGQITEHHGELAAFRFGFAVWGGERVARPDQRLALGVDREPSSVDEFVSKVFEVRIIQTELSLERLIGDPPMAPE
jgi:hypothetical protein